ncbi:uncharacterized protein [Acropora muricata]|uniref:uncharacterized protein n=1 Tax=Acropora muricata TaxID=159855 RepID=UPI0034E42600
MLDPAMAAKSKFNGRLCLSADDVPKEEQANAGCSLLTFMNLASGNVKNALEKPANFKRNINHRRYLQKQLRNFGKRKPNEMILKKPKEVFKHKSNSLSNIKHSTSRNSSGQPEGNFKKAEKNSGFGSYEKPSLRERNLPPSFWQEPLVEDVAQTCMFPLYPTSFHTGANDSEGLYNPTTFESYFDGWSEFAAREVPTESLSPYAESAGAPSVSSEEAINDDFMTGEELTQNIDIKDLYVPELYITDRNSHEHSYDDSLYLAPISPSQYILTPTSCSDQAFFNFAFDHDNSELPPFAMAFLSPGSLAQY